jgi:hypothetical protein
MRCERLAISRWGFGDFSVSVRKHAARWQLCWLWLLGACQLQSSVRSSTQLVIDIEIERSVREQSDRISVTVAQAASAERALRAIPVFAEDFLLTDVDDDRVQRVVLQPRGLATPFVSIRVSAESAQRTGPVAEARLNTRYGQGERRIARLRLGAACIDVSCEASATCADGACVSATASWADLPLFWPSAASDAGRTIERDAGMSLDASSPPLDGALTIVDDSGIVTGLGQALSDDDAGASSDPCAQAHGGCDMRVGCTSARGVVVCGACPSGFDDVHHEGTQCVPVDECAPCAEHASCQNDRCVCERGYHSDGPRCARDDDCQSDADCAAAASCKAGGDGRRSCECRDGYVGDGATCADVDECASGASHCGSGATCVNQPGGASCQCLLGYVMSADGSCADVDECASGASDCDTSPAACVNTPGGFMCQCPAGWSGTGKGADGCAGVNPCTMNNGGCDPLRDCLNTSPVPTCGDCAPGYRKDGATGCVQGTVVGGFPWPPWF